MTEVEELAMFVDSSRFESLSPSVIEQLKIRLLDSLGVALAAAWDDRAAPIQALREVIHDLGGNPVCSLIGGGKTSPDQAALFNGALVRYLDFMDSTLTPGETFH